MIDKIFNYENESKSKWGKNYFFAGTLFIIGLTSLCYFVFDNAFAQIATDIPFLNIILSAFRHGNGLHLFGNMISLLWLGLYFENKIGSLKFIAMFFIFILIGNSACVIYYNLKGYQYIFSGVGGSSANYALFGFFLIAVIFNFKKHMLKGKKSILSYVCFVFIIFFFLLISGNTSGAFAISFGDNLVSNTGHLYPFYAGLIIGFLYYVLKFVWQIISKKKVNNSLAEQQNGIE